MYLPGARGHNFPLPGIGGVTILHLCRAFITKPPFVFLSFSRSKATNSKKDTKAKVGVECLFCQCLLCQKGMQKYTSLNVEMVRQVAMIKEKSGLWANPSGLPGWGWREEWVFYFWAVNILELFWRVMSIFFNKHELFSVRHNAKRRRKIADFLGVKKKSAPNQNKHIFHFPSACSGD